MNYCRYKIKKIKIKLSCKDDEENTEIINMLVSKSRQYSEYCKPKIVLEESKEVSVIKYLDIYKIIKDNNELIIEMDYLSFFSICSNYFKEINKDYKIEVTINFTFDEKLENLLTVYTTRFPKIPINEGMCGERYLNWKKSNLCDLNFVINNSTLENPNNEKLAASLESCSAIYIGDFIESSNRLYNHNLIEIKKDEIVSIDFKEDCVEEIEDICEDINKLLKLEDEDEIIEFLEEYYG